MEISWFGYTSKKQTANTHPSCDPNCRPYIKPSIRDQWPVTETWVLFSFCLTLMGTKLYIMNITLYSISLKTSDWVFNKQNANSAESPLLITSRRKPPADAHVSGHFVLLGCKISPDFAGRERQPKARGWQTTNLKVSDSTATEAEEDSKRIK